VTETSRGHAHVYPRVTCTCRGTQRGPGPPFRETARPGEDIRRGLEDESAAIYNTCLRTPHTPSRYDVHLLEGAILFSYSARLDQCRQRNVPRGQSEFSFPGDATRHTHHAGTSEDVQQLRRPDSLAADERTDGRQGRTDGRTDGRMGPQPRNAPRVTHMLPLQAAPPSTMILRQAMSLRPARPHLAVLARCTYEQHGRAAPVGTEPGLWLLCAASRPPRRPPILEAAG
jgi:hypothetical protein